MKDVFFLRQRGSLIFNDILIVCVGNICRSPAAERILQKKLPLKHISSAGLNAVVDHGIDDKVSELMIANGYDPKNHKARKLEGHMMGSADLILVMEQGHKSAIIKKYPEASGKVMMIGLWCDNIGIQDPFRKSTEAYRQVFEQIEKSCLLWIERLKES